MLYYKMISHPGTQVQGGKTVEEKNKNDLLISMATALSFLAFPAIRTNLFLSPMSIPVRKDLRGNTMPNQ